MYFRYMKGFWFLGPESLRFDMLDAAAVDLERSLMRGWSISSSLPSQQHDEHQSTPPTKVRMISLF